jgi:hypothetical protein
MTKRLQDGGCESLGGEFYLADENFIGLGRRFERDMRKHEITNPAPSVCFLLQNEKW